MYSAEWRGEFEGYATNFLSKNFWRVARTMEREDAMQEAVLVFLRCKSRYEHSVENGAHFMALFKRMLWEHWIGLSNTDTKVRVEISASRQDSEGEDLPDFDLRAGELDVPVQVLEAIRRMPADVRAAVTFLIQGPEPYASKVLENIHKGGPICLARAEADLHRFVGIPAGVPILKKIREHFSPTHV